MFTLTDFKVDTKLPIISIAKFAVHVFLGIISHSSIIIKNIGRSKSKNRFIEEVLKTKSIPKVKPSLRGSTMCNAKNEASLFKVIKFF